MQSRVALREWFRVVSAHSGGGCGSQFTHPRVSTVMTGGASRRARLPRRRIEFWNGAGQRQACGRRASEEGPLEHGDARQARRPDLGYRGLRAARWLPSVVIYLRAEPAVGAPCSAQGRRPRGRATPRRVVAVATPSPGLLDLHGASEQDTGSVSAGQGTCAHLLRCNLTGDT